jgi:competence protein ComGC
MDKPKGKLPITFVNVFVVMAILMILSALIVPVLVPPESGAASRGSALHTSSTPTKR